MKNTPCLLSLQSVAPVGPFIAGSYADRRKPPLIAVSHVRLLWVEIGRLTHAPELFVTADYTGKPR